MPQQEELVGGGVVSITWSSRGVMEKAAVEGCKGWGAVCGRMDL